MIDEDFLPLKKKPALKNLDPLSVDELHVYIADMQTEIARAENEITRKKSVAQAADAFFKKSS